MKKLSLIVICALTALFFASCQTGKREDKNGNTPTSVVEKMYEAIKTNDFATAASYNKLPDTIKMKDGNVYKEFNNNNKKGDKVIVTGEEWKNSVVSKMEEQSKASNYVLKSYEVVSEEISNTDPNSAKVKTKITYSKNGVDGEAECSFPLKRDNDVWLIIG
jgi:hypothetical protein